nr:hypothetical protein BaRGS_033514 [Batillaria attramentaria]
MMSLWAGTVVVACSFRNLEEYVSLRIGVLFWSIFAAVAFTLLERNDNNNNNKNNHNNNKNTSNNNNNKIGDANTESEV